MIHSDRHQINAALAWVTAVGSRRVLRVYRYKCILMSRSVSVFPLISILHTSFLLLISSYDSSRSRSNALNLHLLRAASTDRPLSRSPFLPSSSFVSLSPRIALFSLFHPNPILRVNIIESPRIPNVLFLLLFTTRSILNEYHQNSGRNECPSITVKGRPSMIDIRSLNFISLRDAGKIQNAIRSIDVIQWFSSSAIPMIF